ncbi:MAG: PQQ-binding-like beta-propeller repeat protein [Phycisphaerae bacterium]|nr:PQQ-binding-like beta-propeller repeat protein [Phycisphaerae bacterium]
MKHQQKTRGADLRGARRSAVMGLVAIVLACCVSTVARAETWPTHRHDPQRSGVTSEALTPPLAQAWIFTSKHRPNPAWHGPARRDGWHKTENLKPKMVFDWAFHVVADDASVYFGSSADDKIYCLDAKTGKQRWNFFSDGPIRFAPTLADGKVYVGSDDGVAYCLSAADGKVIWKYQASPKDHRLAGNERIMSLWPVRSGIVVDGPAAYFCAGLFAFEGTYLCAVDAQTGKEQWKRRYTGVCPQGYMLASKEWLYLPAGGSSPAVFKRENGKHVYTLDGAGGAFAVLSDEALISGPGNLGTLDAFKAGGQDHIASFAGNMIVVTPRMSYLHTDTELSALDRTRYLELCDERNRLNRRIDAAKKQLAKANPDVDYDPRNAFHIGTYKDDNENYVFKGLIGEVRVWNVARDPAAIKADMMRTLSDRPKELIGYWRCDEGAGDTVADTVGKSPGKLIDAPKWVEAAERPGPPSGKALAFDGTASYVVAGKDAILRTPRDVTIEAWIRPQEREKWSGIAGCIWDSGSTESGYGLTLDDVTGVWFGLKTGAGEIVYLSTGPDTIPLDQWRHVAGTYDGRVMKVYVDGELKASKEIFGPTTESPEEITERIRGLEADVARISGELPKCVGWKRHCKYPYSLVLADQTLYAGGTNEVAAFDAKDGKTLWNEKVSGRALDLAVAGGRLIVSTDQGAIYCFAKQ